MKGKIEITALAGGGGRKIYGEDRGCINKYRGRVMGIRDLIKEEVDCLKDDDIYLFMAIKGGGCSGVTTMYSNKCKTRVKVFRELVRQILDARSEDFSRDSDKVVRQLMQEVEGACEDWKNEYG